MDDVGCSVREDRLDLTARQSDVEAADRHRGDAVDRIPRVPFVPLGCGLPRARRDDDRVVAAGPEVVGDPANARGDTVEAREERLGDDRDPHASTLAGPDDRGATGEGVLGDLPVTSAAV
jgi:hypothetical protein